VKGKGPTPTWLLLGHQPGRVDDQHGHR
jgi:hypothetical protein